MERPGLPLLFATGLGLIALISLIDWVTGGEVSVSIFYLLPIAYGAWHGNLRVGLPLAVAAAAAWLMVERTGDTIHTHPFIPIWNAAARLGVFVVVTLLMCRVRQLTLNLESLVEARTTALADEVQHRLRAEHEVAEAAYREQERLAYEIHDQLGGSLAGLAFQAKAAAQRLERQTPAAAGEVAELVARINDTNEQVRQLARLLAPHQASGDNLAHSLTELGRHFAAVFGVTCQVEVPSDLPPLSGGQCHQLYYIAKEACRNAIQHGRASQLAIRAQPTADHLELEVRGLGHPNMPEPDSGAGLGLRIMRYRAGLLGGSLDFHLRTEAPPHHSAVLCRIPVLPATTRKE